MLKHEMAVLAPNHPIIRNHTGKNKMTFDEEMFQIYYRAKSGANYTASQFLNMLHESGGLNTAKRLIHAPRVSSGYTAL